MIVIKMSPRLKKLRKVLNPPPIKGFKPYGPDLDKVGKDPILMHFEEYESLRLCDYDMFNHHQASAAMGVSRPTFTRIYASARQKVAKAFAEGRQISIEGGKVYFDSDWYSCNQCRCYFNNPKKDEEITHCPLCGSERITSCDVETECLESTDKRCEEICICSACGFEQPHLRGQPCSRQLCPQCGKHMMRKQNTNKQ
jgi:uncharacterized protein